MKYIKEVVHFAVEGVVMEKQRLTIKGDQDKLTVAAILIANNYTVRLVTIKDENKRPTKVIEFYKE